MQGQRSAKGSRLDPINLDFGSTSSNIAMEQHGRWNNPCEREEEARNLSRRSIGESSSSHPQIPNNHHEQRAPTGWWSSLSTSGGSGRRLDSQLYEPSDVALRNSVNLNLSINQMPSEPSLVQRSSTSTAVSRSHNINLGQLGRVGGDPMDCPNSSKSGMLEHRLFPSSTGSEHFASSSRSGDFLVEDDDSRTGFAMDGRRMSCKRKTIEGNAGPSSNSGSYFSREGNMWQAPQAIPPFHNTGSSSVNLSSQPETTPLAEPVNHRLELSMSGLAPYSPHTSGAESSQRNHRLRMNPSNGQDSLSRDPCPPRVIAEALPSAEDVGFVSASNNRQLLPHAKPTVIVEPGPVGVSFRSFYASMGVQLPPRSHMPPSQLQHVEENIRSAQRYVPTATVEGVSMSRDDVQIDPQAQRETGRRVETLFEARRRALNRHNPPDAGLNIASSSRVAPGSGSQSSPVPSWGSSRRQQASAEYTRRLTEYVRSEGLTPPGSEIGRPAAAAAASSSSTHRSVPSPSQDTLFPSGGGGNRHNPLLSRSHPTANRHGAGGNGIPSSSRTLPAANEGRIRLVTEHVQQIRNVLDMMRRGEGLRFEDVMVLDPSVLFGMADANDQHRDMRLDVDNMSYEELLALEDRIGSVSTGITAETVAARLKRRKYFAIARSNRAEVEPCCICQEDYKNGDDLGTLDCGHDFHTECIKQWLGEKNLCPICKTTGLAT